jgi:serpin B
MKKMLSLIYWRHLQCAAIALVSVLISACRQSDSTLPVSTDEKLVVDGNNAFAVDLYQQLKGQQGNLFFSPYSIYASLAMVHGGARGQTEMEITNTMHLSLSQDALPAVFGVLMAQMNEVQHRNRIELATADSLWAHQDCQFKDDFLTSIKTYYQADIYNVDFKENPQSVSDRINSWVDQKTKGNIQNLVKKDQITKDVRLILCNAIYFKGKWADQFKVKDTQPAAFFVSSNETVTVPMMRQTSRFKMAYIDDNDLCLLELPYAGNYCSMIILLPGTTDGLPAIEQQLTAENLKAWLEKFRQRSMSKTDIELPRFKASQNIDLATVLTQMGMPLLFGTNADLSGMTGQRNLFISDAVYKTLVEVDESGTSAVGINWFAAKAASKPTSFIANHPFIFLIRENHTGNILFFGRVTDPLQE